MLSPAFPNRLRAALAALTLVLLALAAPAMATAAAPPPVDTSPGPPEPPQFSVEMSLSGSHGYHVGVSADDHRTVTITVFKGDAFALYSVPGRVTEDRVEADFGQLGRVSVRFTPANRRAFSGPKSGCHAARGRFDGVIRFRGEQGYTRVAAKGARGAVNPDGGRGCVISHASTRFDRLALLAQPGNLKLSVTALGAVARSKERSVAFYDIDLIPDAESAQGIEMLSVPLATVEEHLGRVSILRLALDLLNRPVAVPSAPGVQPFTIAVKAPRPFQGTGSYLAAPGAAPSWTGDLAVELPGAGLVPLTGPEFVTRICNGALDKANEACLDDLKDFVEAPRSPLTPF